MQVLENGCETIKSIKELDIGTRVLHVNRGLGKVMEFKPKEIEVKGPAAAHGPTSTGLGVLMDKLGMHERASAGASSSNNW